MSKFIRLKGTAGEDINVNTAHLINFVQADGKSYINVTGFDDSVQVVESARVIRGLIEGKAEAA